MKSLAFDKAKWKLGNGQDINFWHDEWLRADPLWDIDPFNKWANACIDRFGYRVNDYRDHTKWIDLAKMSEELKP